MEAIKSAIKAEIIQHRGSPYQPTHNIIHQAKWYYLQIRIYLQLSKRVLHITRPNFPIS